MDTCGWDASCRPTERGGEVKREVKENKPTSHEYVILLRLRIKSSHRTIGPLTDTISIFSLSLSLEIPRKKRKKEVVLNRRLGKDSLKIGGGERSWAVYHSKFDKFAVAPRKARNKKARILSARFRYFE